MRKRLAPWAFGLPIVMIIAGLLAAGCGGSSGKPDSGPAGPVKLEEPKELAQAGEGIEEALKAGDPARFQEYIAPDRLPQYESAITGNAEKLAGFLEIFESRKLIALDRIHAVYEVTLEGQTFEITMTLGEDGAWRLADF